MAGLEVTGAVRKVGVLHEIAIDGKRAVLPGVPREGAMGLGETVESCCSCRKGREAGRAALEVESVSEAGRAASGGWESGLGGWESGLRRPGRPWLVWPLPWATRSGDVAPSVGTPRRALDHWLWMKCWELASLGRGAVAQGQ